MFYGNLLFAFVAGAFAQDNATPAAVPSAAPVARRVRISFVPPPIEGTISLGIFDSSGKLVRVLDREAKIEDFEIGHDALSVVWDGENDAGEPLPAGKYNARGYAVGSLQVGPIAYFFNDWVTGEDSPRVKHIGELALENIEMRVNVDLASGEKATFVCDPLSGTIIRKTDHKVLAKSGPPTQLPRNIAVAPLAYCDGKDESLWFIDNVGDDQAREVKQLSKTHQLVRTLAFVKDDPQPQDVAASITDDRLFLLEENATMQRLRGLIVDAAKTDGTQQMVSDLKTVFEKKILAHKDFTIENGKPLARAANEKILPEKVSLRLASNPLANNAGETIQLSAGFDEEGSFLKTTDGLPLLTISQARNLIRIVISPRGDKSVDVFQDDGAVVEQFRVSGADQMMAFDCGDFDLK